MNNNKLNPNNIAVDQQLFIVINDGSKAYERVGSISGKWLVIHIYNTIYHFVIDAQTMLVYFDSTSLDNLVGKAYLSREHYERAW